MRPRSKKKIYSPKQQTKPNFALGCQGENIGAVFLQENNFEILERNFLGAGGCEIDLIALDHHCKPPELVFIEVKTRAQKTFGDPSQAITTHKIHQLQKAASTFLAQFTSSFPFHQLNYRFDALAIIYNPKNPTLPPEITHYQNITW